jgi:hypothetical protein
MKIREATFLFSINVKSSDEGFGPAADLGDDYNTTEYWLNAQHFHVQYIRNVQFSM